jgi:hypothetical protein
LKASNAEVIQHLPSFVIRDALNCFGVHDQAVLDDEIGNVLADNLAFVLDSVAFVLRIFDPPQSELDAKAVLVNPFV